MWKRSIPWEDYMASAEWSGSIVGNALSGLTSSFNSTPPTCRDCWVMLCLYPHHKPVHQGLLGTQDSTWQSSVNHGNMQTSPPQRGGSPQGGFSITCAHTHTRSLTHCIFQWISNYVWHDRSKWLCLHNSVLKSARLYEKFLSDT